MARMPKLSEDLPQNVSPLVCQSCGTDDPRGWMEYWREHDEKDQPTRVIITLCNECSQRIIEPHPRLYSRLERHKPQPGIMELCHDCTHRQCNYCTFPGLKENGGMGMVVHFPRPSLMFLDGVRNGRKVGWQEMHYPGPATYCEGRREKDPSK